MKLVFLVIFFSTISCGQGHLFNSLTDEKPIGIISGGESEFSQWPNSRYEFDISFIEKPKIAIDSPFILHFWDAYQDDHRGPYTYLNEKLCVFLWMKMPSGAEHGSSPVEISKADNTYLISDVYFIMPGNWKVYIRTIDDDQVCSKSTSFIEEKIIEVNL